MTDGARRQAHRTPACHGAGRPDVRPRSCVLSRGSDPTCAGTVTSDDRAAVAVNICQPGGHPLGRCKGRPASHSLVSPSAETIAPMASGRPQAIRPSRANWWRFRPTSRPDGFSPSHCARSMAGSPVRSRLRECPHLFVTSELESA